jgi:hypothetical protein
MRFRYEDFVFGWHGRLSRVFVDHLGKKLHCERMAGEIGQWLDGIIFE